MIRVGIIGATGYAGNELVRILLGHKETEIIWYGSRSYINENYADIYRNMFQLVDAKCMDDNMELLASQVDVIFTATPQGLCASLVNEEILNKVKIIDLSADFRLKDVHMKIGIRLSIKHHSILRKLYMDCVKLIEIKLIKIQELLQIQAVIQRLLY